jgi:hypothetical protein
MFEFIALRGFLRKSGGMMSWPRYMRIDTGMKILPIDLSVQLLPGTFKHALSHLRTTGIGRENGKKPGAPSGKRNREIKSATD